MRTYLSVRFRPRDKKSYAYANDGPPVRVGDRVNVPDKSGDGWSAAEVVAVDIPKPTAFECKPILGLVDGAAIDERLLSPSKGAPPDLFRDYVEDTRAGIAGPDLSSLPGWGE